MKPILTFFATLVMISGSYGDPELPMPAVSEVKEIDQLESLSSQEAIKSFRKYANAGEFGDRAKEKLARNPQLVPWLTAYFKDTPVLFENYAERRSIITTISELPAEWSVRFLLELSRDDRPMTSTRYDYDDPEFQKRVKEEAAANASSDDTGDLLFRRYGYGPPGGANQNLAFEALGVMKEFALLTQAKAGVRNPSVPSVAGLSPDSERVVQVVKGMWGDKAILNQELGLGLDNAPVRTGSATAPERAHRRNHRAGYTVTAEERATPGIVSAKSTKHVLFLACGLLVAGLATVGWRRMKAG